MITIGENNKYILLVPDSLFWVTGRIARELSKVLRAYGSEPIICSGPVLTELLSSNPDFVKQISIVHFLTPHLATNFKKYFYETSAFVSTIHHIENAASSEPEAYSDAIMTVSRQWHNELHQRGAPASKLVMIQNGVDIDLFQTVNKKTRTKLRDKYGLAHDAFIVGFSAKRDSDSCGRKGIDVLESLIRATSNRTQKLFTWFVRGPGWNDLIDSLRSNGAQVHYCPFLDSDKALAESYQVLDSFVITSRIEGGPVPLLEAMACGLPVVTTGVGVALEIVSDCTNGYKVEFNSPEQMQSRLEMLMSNPEVAASVGARARQTIVDELQWKDTARNILDLYSIAEQNFRIRSVTTHGIGAAAMTNGRKIKLQRRWIYARECVFFANFLKRNEAHFAAIKIVSRVFLTSPSLVVKTVFSILCSRVPKILSGCVLKCEK